MSTIPVADADRPAAIINGDPVIDETTVEVLPEFLSEHEATLDGPDA